MWQETKHGLYKRFVFDDFRQAFAFMTHVAEVAEKLNHHPRWQNEWNEVDIWLSTHEAGIKITEKDRQLAVEIDALTVQPKDIQSEPVVDKKATNTTEVKLYADGGSRGNPGPSASGFVLQNMMGETLFSAGVYLGVTTNNQAEYQALKLGLEKALSMRIATVHVYMDSMLVINQMKGIF